MPMDELKTWYVGRLQALVMAADMSAEAATANADEVRSSELKAMLEDGARIAKEQKEQLRAMLKRADAAQDGKADRVLEGVSAAGEADAQSLSDPAVRDLGVIAITQVGLHYYIAAYGTLAATARMLNLEDEATAFVEMNKHMKEKDEAYSQIAERLGSELANA